MIEIDFRRARDVIRDGVAYRPPPHVEEGVRALIKHPYFFLTDEMGAMKTAQVVIAACMLYEAGVIERVIVVAPSDARPVWYDEDIGQLKEQLFEGLDATVVEFHSRIKRWNWGNPKAEHRMHWIVTNFEFIRRKDNLVLLANFCGPKTLLVVDESSYVRTHDSKQTEAVMALRWKLNGGCGRVVEMNGTPIMESPEDLFAQGNLLHPSILECKYITHFRNRYGVMVPVLGVGGRPVLNKGGHAVQRVEKWVQLDDLEHRFAPYVLRRLTRDCVDMPPELAPEHREVRMSDTTWRVYKAMRDEMVAELKSGGTAVTQHAATKVMRLGQITSGLVGGIESDAFIQPEEFDFEQPEGMSFIQEDPLADPFVPTPEEFLAVKQEATQFIGREKLDWFLEWHARMLKADPNLKLIVRCRWVPELRRLLEECSGLSMPVGCLAGEPLLGGKFKDERKAALRLLHPATAPPGPVLVGQTTTTGSFAHNFTACHTVMNLSFDYSRGQAKQADKRTDRPGQRHPVTNWFLVAVGPKGQRTVEHDILASRAAKEDVSKRATDGWITVLKREE